MTALRVLIADDEQDARDKLRRLLSRTIDTIVVAEASNGRETLERVTECRPDVVLLDIRMPELDGLRAAETIATRGAQGAPAPKVVFITAFDEYAVRAFEARAFDYLLKPFDAERLDAALDRVRAQIELEHRPQTAVLNALLERLQTTPPSGAGAGDKASHFLERVCVQSNGRTQIVRMADVDWIEACGNYVRLHTAASGRPMLRETLSHFVTQLDPAQFARIHRSAIVPLDRIREMRPSASGDYVVELTSGARLRLSRSYRAEVDRRLSRRA
jgi:two-component system LytT family response regulator